MSLLTVENLSKHYEGRRSLVERMTGVPQTVVRAVNGIDLTVMGAYGHSRLRRFFIGSHTTEMLSESRQALLMLR